VGWLLQEILADFREKVVLPLDLAVTENGARKELDARDLPTDGAIVDVGHDTVATYCRAIATAGTVCVNGPLGVYEDHVSEYGTQTIWEAIASSRGHSALGGGDSMSAMNKYALRERFDYVCTAGGGMVRFLSGEELPVVTALRMSAVRFR